MAVMIPCAVACIKSGTRSTHNIGMHLTASSLTFSCFVKIDMIELLKHSKLNTKINDATVATKMAISVYCLASLYLLAPKALPTKLAAAILNPIAVIYEIWHSKIMIIHALCWSGPRIPDIKIKHSNQKYSRQNIIIAGIPILRYSYKFEKESPLMQCHECSLRIY